MPIFEYRCRDCDSIFEKIQRTPAEQETCPRCGGVSLRAVSTPSVGVSSSGPAISGPAAGCGTGGFS